MNRRQMAALTLAGVLVGHSATAGLAIPGRRHPLVQAGIGTALAVAARAPLGLGGDAARSGLTLGGAVAAVVGAAVSATTAIPVVWAEETMYRGALGSVAADAFGPGAGRLLQAAAFGLSHIVDARATGEPVVGTVLVTGAAGWLFGWLADRSASLLAPMLVHLATNESGAVAALAVQRRSVR